MKVNYSCKPNTDKDLNLLYTIELVTKSGQEITINVTNSFATARTHYIRTAKRDDGCQVLMLCGAVVINHSDCGVDIEPNSVRPFRS